MTGVSEAFPAELAYLREVEWMRDHGLITSWFEYECLPDRVKDDCRLFAPALEMRIKEMRREAAKGG